MIAFDLKEGADSRGPLPPFAHGTPSMGPEKYVSRILWNINQSSFLYANYLRISVRWARKMAGAAVSVSASALPRVPNYTIVCGST